MDSIHPVYQFSIYDILIVSPFRKIRLYRRYTSNTLLGDTCFQFECIFAPLLRHQIIWLTNNNSAIYFECEGETIWIGMRKEETLLREIKVNNPNHLQYLMHNSYNECIQSTLKGYLVLKTTIKFLLASKAHNVAEKCKNKKNLQWSFWSYTMNSLQ